MAHPAVRRDPERGAALVLTLITIAALLGLGAITVLTVQSELGSSGQSRRTQQALYAAESGAAAGMDFLRTSCSPYEAFSALVTPGNSAPLEPEGIYGNHDSTTTDPENFFYANGGVEDVWYSVAILNNRTDAGFADGTDQDFTVIIRSTGHGPDGTVVTIDVEVFAAACKESFCAQDFAQRNITARNDANAVCSTRVEPSAGTRTIVPGGGP